MILYSKYVIEKKVKETRTDVSIEMHMQDNELDQFLFQSPPPLSSGTRHPMASEAVPPVSAWRGIHLPHEDGHITKLTEGETRFERWW